MSVTFSIDALPTGKFSLSPACAFDGKNPFDGVVFDSYDAAIGAAADHKEVCEDCRAYNCWATAILDVPEDLDVNVANSNARRLLERLGVEDAINGGDLCGSMPAADFLGRVLIALGSLDGFAGADEGLSPVTEKGRGGATFVDCGLPPGYFGMTFERLHALAEEATRLGREVVWS